MPIRWQSSAEVFASILRRHGVEPDAVRDVEATWAAFQEFAQIEVDGIEASDSDGDSIIAQWGRWDWNVDLPALSFGRLLQVAGDSDRNDPHWQPTYWQVALELHFADDPAWSDVDQLGFQDTGFDSKSDRAGSVPYRAVNDGQPER